MNKEKHVGLNTLPRDTHLSRTANPTDPTDYHNPQIIISKSRKYQKMLYFLKGGELTLSNMISCHMMIIMIPYDDHQNRKDKICAIFNK